MKTILSYDDFVNESKINLEENVDVLENIDVIENEETTEETTEEVSIEETEEISEEYEVIEDEELLESKLQDDYREFFKHVLDLYEVKSPASIKDEECKKEFFNKIQLGWIKGEGLSEYGKKLMDCECLDEDGNCCEKED